MAFRAITTILSGVLLAGCVTATAQTMPGTTVTYWQEYVVGRSSAPAQYIALGRAALEDGLVTLTLFDQSVINERCGDNRWGCSVGRLQPPSDSTLPPSCAVIASEEIADKPQLLAYLVGDHEAAHCLNWGVGDAYHPIGVNPTDQQLAYYTLDKAQELIGTAIAAANRQPGTQIDWNVLDWVMTYCDAGRAAVIAGGVDPATLPACR